MGQKTPALAPFGEGLEEGVTQITQNIVDKYTGAKPDIKITEGAADAFWIGLGMGAGMGGGLYATKKIVNGKVVERPHEELAKIQQNVDENKAKKEADAKVQQFVGQLTHDDGNVHSAELPGGEKVYITGGDITKPQSIDNSYTILRIDPKTGELKKEFAKEKIGFITTQQSQDVFDQYQQEAYNRIGVQMEQRKQNDAIATQAQGAFDVLTEAYKSQQPVEYNGRKGVISEANEPGKNITITLTDSAEPTPVIVKPEQYGNIIPIKLEPKEGAGVQAEATQEAPALTVTIGKNETTLPYTETDGRIVLTTQFKNASEANKVLKALADQIQEPQFEIINTPIQNGRVKVNNFSIQEVQQPVSDVQADVQPDVQPADQVPDVGNMIEPSPDMGQIEQQPTESQGATVKPDELSGGITEVKVSDNERMAFAIKVDEDVKIDDKTEIAYFNTIGTTKESSKGVAGVINILKTDESFVKNAYEVGMTYVFKSQRGKGLGRKAIIDIGEKLNKNGYKLLSDDSRSDDAEKMWKWMESQGKAIKIPSKIQIEYGDAEIEGMTERARYVYQYVPTKQQPVENIGQLPTVAENAQVEPGVTESVTESITEPVTENVTEPLAISTEKGGLSQKESIEQTQPSPSPVAAVTDQPNEVLTGVEAEPLDITYVDENGNEIEKPNEIVTNKSVSQPTQPGTDQKPTDKFPGDILNGTKSDKVAKTVTDDDGTVWTAKKVKGGFDIFRNGEKQNTGAKRFSDIDETINTLREGTKAEDSFEGILNWKSVGEKYPIQRTEDFKDHIVDVSREFNNLKKVTGYTITISKRNNDGTFTIKKQLRGYKTQAEAKRDAQPKFIEYTKSIQVEPKQTQNGKEKETLPGEVKEVQPAPVEEKTETSSFDKIISASSRFKPKERIVFEKPLIGKSGAKLVSYEWQYTYDLKDAGDEGTVEKRVSDWTKAETSADTGRDIVHQFTVEMPNGETKTVSSESVLVLLGYSEREGLKGFPSLVNAVKSLAKQQMQLAVLEAQKKQYDDAYEYYTKADKPEIVAKNDSFLGKKRAEKGEVSGYNRFYMGDSFVDQPNKWNGLGMDYTEITIPSKETISNLTDTWIKDQIKKTGILNPSYKITELKNRIERQQRRVNDIISKEVSAEENKSTELITEPTWITGVDLKKKITEELVTKSGKSKKVTKSVGKAQSELKKKYSAAESLIDCLHGN